MKAFKAFLFFILIVVAIAFTFYRGWFSFEYNDPFAPDTQIIDAQNSSQMIVNYVNYGWCEIKDLSSGKILGWDTLNNCCVQVYNTTSNVVERCYIGDVNPQVKWAKVNGTLLNNTNDYEGYI